MKPDTYLRQVRNASKRELVAAVLELARMHYDTESRELVSVSRPRQAYEQLRDIARGKQEQLVGLYLDAQNKLIARRTISIGSLNTTRSHPREILYPAVQHLACGFILGHNHPSGSLEPSREDIEFTQAARRAGELLGIELYDHLIIAATGFTSLRERGLL